MNDPKVLRPDLESGYFEELDYGSTPWKGRGRFRFQAQARRRIDKRVLSRAEVDQLMAASYETPQRVGIEGDRRHWWAFEGYWYITRADLGESDVVGLVQERYQEELAAWGVSPSPAPPRPPAREHGSYLAVCSMFLNEERYLAEWIEFHLLAGVERFYLYDHESTDGSREVLAPYVEEGTVIVYDWPVYPGQREAFDDCVERHRGIPAGSRSSTSTSSSSPERAARCLTFSARSSRGPGCSSTGSRSARPAGKRCRRVS